MNNLCHKMATVTEAFNITTFSQIQLCYIAVWVCKLGLQVSITDLNTGYFRNQLIDANIIN